MVGINSVMGLLHDTAVFTYEQVESVGYMSILRVTKSLYSCLRQQDRGNESGAGSRVREVIKCDGARAMFIFDHDDLVLTFQESELLISSLIKIAGQH